MLILIIFLAELAAAILAFVFREHVSDHVRHVETDLCFQCWFAANISDIFNCACLQLTREYFTKELKRHYQGYNNTDVFTSTWNAIMNTVCLVCSLNIHCCRSAFTKRINNIQEPLHWHHEHVLTGICPSVLPSSLTAVEWTVQKTSRRASLGL